MKMKRFVALRPEGKGKCLRLASHFDGDMHHHPVEDAGAALSQARSDVRCSGPLVGRCKHERTSRSKRQQFALKVLF